MKIFNSLLNLIYPNVCEVCGRSLVGNEQVMCLHCMADMPLTNAHRDDFSIIHKRLASTMAVERTAGYFYYFKNDDYTRLIHRAKYSGRPKLARQLAWRFAHGLAEEGFFEGVDFAVPVPMHWMKLILPTERLLVATRGHRSQTALGGLGRWLNLQDVYRVRDGAVDFGGKHLLLVDDVLTTGATLLSCRKAIYEAFPNAKVSVLVLGVTRLS